MSKKQELGPLQTEWINRLRSGKYKQGAGYLKYFADDGECSYCCLGVACDVAEQAGVQFKSHVDVHRYVMFDGQHTASLPVPVRHAMGFRDMYGNSLSNDGDSLASLNDGGKSFVEIADIVCKDPSQYFTNPA